MALRHALVLGPEGPSLAPELDNLGPDTALSRSGTGFQVQTPEM